MAAVLFPAQPILSLMEADWFPAGPTIYLIAAVKFSDDAPLSVRVAVLCSAYPSMCLTAAVFSQLALL